ncbi:hypothetical protein EIN_265000 [Entamoeba invadens IP1]|uniref:Uncharacterized protein n=1 Tax=Entamoeba invadens IP1 TaxID=370355 RepID=A0A0A1U2F0_ENTIV|nr:hypothetical protein EIN_265000 [Entamoeba invadens IP1]ELP85703.1 hypothetical protein EIN_265000 [Entamoeba invadens IP1]|eukprot:XP_004185049.1 hypothetical protein EIN_265000 [Entamoeba invadens IP1]
MFLIRKLIGKMLHMWGLLSHSVIPLVLFCYIIKPDYSIWKENIDACTSLSVPLQYYGFTQIQGHHRLLAAAMEEKYYKDTKRAELQRKRHRTYQLHLRNCSRMKRKDTSSKPFDRTTKSDRRHVDCNCGVQ